MAPHHHPVVAFGEIFTIAPIAVPVELRPDGPLARDLAAWVKAPTIAGEHPLGPIPFQVTTADLLDGLDQVLTTGDLARWAGAYVDLPVIVLATGNPATPYVALVGFMLPTAWHPPT